jgi:hypothetical protein
MAGHGMDRVSRGAERDSATEFGMHVVLCAVLGFFLFRRDASSYFLRTR